MPQVFWETKPVSIGGTSYNGICILFKGVMYGKYSRGTEKTHTLISNQSLHLLQKYYDNVSRDGVNFLGME